MRTTFGSQFVRNKGQVAARRMKQCQQKKGRGGDGEHSAASLKPAGFVTAGTIGEEKRTWHAAAAAATATANRQQTAAKVWCMRMD